MKISTITIYLKIFSSSAQYTALQAVFSSMIVRSFRASLSGNNARMQSTLLFVLFYQFSFIREQWVIRDKLHRQLLHEFASYERLSSCCRTMHRSSPANSRAQFSINLYLSFGCRRARGGGKHHRMLRVVRKVRVSDRRMRQLAAMRAEVTNSISCPIDFTRQLPNISCMPTRKYKIIKYHYRAKMSRWRWEDDENRKVRSKISKTYIPTFYLFLTRRGAAASPLKENISVRLLTVQISDSLSLTRFSICVVHLIIDIACNII